MRNTILKDGTKIYHHDKGDFIGDLIEKTNDYYENDFLRQINKMGIFPKGNYIEIGANIGNHILFYSKHTKAQKITAFEPLVDNYKLAERNIKENSLKNVELKRYGLGIKNEKINFFINPNNYGNSSINSQGIPNQKEVQVEIRSVFDILPDLVKEASFIKVDVEGAEKYFISELLEIIGEKSMTLWIELRSFDYSLDEYVNIEKKLKSTGMKLIFNEGFDFVFSSQSKLPKQEIHFKDVFLKSWVRKIRSIYDYSTSKSEIKQLQKDYKNLLSQIKVSLFQRLIWSKLYRLFTGKWLKTQ